MTMGKIDKLVRMANQIGDFYATMPEKEAVDGAASHLRLYWTPKMIRELAASLRRAARPESHRGACRRSAEARLRAPDARRGPTGVRLT